MKPSLQMADWVLKVAARILRPQLPHQAFTFDLLFGRRSMDLLKVPQILVRNSQDPPNPPPPPLSPLPPPKIVCQPQRTLAPQTPLGHPLTPPPPPPPLPLRFSTHPARLGEPLEGLEVVPLHGLLGGALPGRQGGLKRRLRRAGGFARMGGCARKPHTDMFFWMGGEEIGKEKSH